MNIKKITEEPIERKALKAIIKEAAKRDGMTKCEWYKAHGLLQRTASNHGMPSVQLIYIVCEAAGIRPSRFFAAIGK